MKLSRRDFLKGSLGLAASAVLPTIVYASSDDKGLTMEVYNKLIGLVNKKSDLIPPEIDRRDKSTVQRVIEVNNKRYTAVAINDSYGKRIEIHQRTKGTAYNASYVFTGDVNLDGVVDKGTSDKFCKRVILPEDLEWKTHKHFFAEKHHEALKDLSTYLK